MFKDRMGVSIDPISHENKKDTVNEEAFGIRVDNIRKIIQNTSKVLSNAFSKTNENTRDTTPETDGNGDNFDDLSKYLIFNEGKSSSNLERNTSLGKNLNGITKTPLVSDSEKTGKTLNLSRQTEEYIWKPGFCLQLGSRGRKAMLKLIRNAYKSNKGFKRVFEKKNPPTTISNLPFFRVSMLWELAHDLNVLDEAILIHKCFGKVKNKTKGQTHISCNVAFKETNTDNGIFIKDRVLDPINDKHDLSGKRLKENTPDQIFTGMHETDKIKDKVSSTVNSEQTKDFDVSENEMLLKKGFQLDSSILNLSTSPSSLSTEVTSLNDGQNNEDENTLQNEPDLVDVSLPFGLLDEMREEAKNVEENNKTHGPSDTTRAEFGKLALYLSREYKFLNASN